MTEGRVAKIARLTGPITATSGLLIAVTTIVVRLVSDPKRPETFDDPIVVINGVVALAGSLLLLLAVIGLYERLADSAGAFHFISFLVVLLGSAMLAGDYWLEAFAAPFLAQVAPAVAEAPGGFLVAGAIISFALFIVGWLLFGIAMIRSGLFPRVATSVVVLGAVVGAPPGELGKVGFGLGLVWVGVWLILARKAESENPTPAPAAGPGF